MNPNFLIANNNLAIAYTDLGTKIKNEGNVAGGVKLYKQALVYNSKYPAAWYNLGVAYVRGNSSSSSSDVWVVADSHFLFGLCRRSRVDAMKQLCAMKWR